MKVFCNKDLSLNFDLKEGGVIVGDLNFDTKDVSLSRRMSELYMQSIGFEPYIEDYKLHHYKIDKLYNGAIYVEYLESQGNCSSIKDRINITNEECISDFNILNGFTFIDTKLEENPIISPLSMRFEESLIISKYKIQSISEDSFKVIKLDDFELKIKDKNLIIYKDYEIIPIDELSDFFNDIHYGERGTFEAIYKYIFNSFAKEKGFNDIYIKFKEFIISEPFNLKSYFEIFSFLFYTGQIKFYYLSEYLIKTNMFDKLANYNPVVSKKDIPDPQNIKILSKISLEKKQEYRMNKDEVELLLSMEENKKIGVDGIKIIFEYLEEIKKIPSSWESPFTTSRMMNMVGGINDILNRFEITPKNLMNKIVRMIFNENISPYQFINIVNDTVNMANILSVEIGDKLPSDILRIHDTLKDQIAFIENKEIETKFKVMVNENNKLLDKIPTSSKFTIISPQNPNDLILEGMKLNHCVGSYIDRYVNGYSKIFFIRKIDNIQTPYATLDLNRYNNVNQIAGRSNKTVDKEVIEFVNNWLKSLENLV